MYKQANRRIGTSPLNKVLRAAVDANPPPVREGKTPKIYYATQVGVAPPTIVLFVNRPSLFDAPYQRYLLNTFRQKLPYKDIPIKMYLRARTQTDASQRGGGDEDESTKIRVHGPRFAVDELDDEVNDLLDGLED